MEKISMVEKSAYHGDASVPTSDEKRLVDGDIRAYALRFSWKGLTARPDIGMFRRL